MLIGWAIYINDKLITVQYFSANLGKKGVLKKLRSIYGRGAKVTVELTGRSIHYDNGIFIDGNAEVQPQVAGPLQ